MSSFENNNDDNRRFSDSEITRPPQQQQQQQQEPVRFTSRDLDIEYAEGQVFESVEEKHRRGSTASSLVGGTYPPPPPPTSNEPRLLPARSSSSHQSQPSAPILQDHDSMTSSISSEPTATGRKPKTRFFEVAQQVRRMNMVKAAMQQHKHSAAAAGRAAKTVHSLLQDIQEEEESVAILNSTASQQASTSGATNARGRRTSEKDGLMRKTVGEIRKDNPYATNYDHHLLKAGSSSSSDSEDEDGIGTGMPVGVPPPKGHYRSQSAPLNFATTAGSTSLPLHQPSFQPRSASDYIATAHDGYIDAGATHHFTASAGLLGDYPHHHYQDGKANHSTKKKHFFPRWLREVGHMLHPLRVARNCLDILVGSYFLWVGVPSLLASACLFYLLNNPELDFLPGEATLAWWLLFVVRQTVTLGLARMTVHVCIDGFMLGTRLAVQTLGPLLTLTAATGKGWPLITACWGMWDLLLLHGDNRFQRNWLYFTGMELFSNKYDSGGYLLSSSLYTRILLSAVIAGLAVSAKRTVLALRFGRKQFAEFKPRLERILADVVLLSEIATLAEQAEKVEETEAEEMGSWDLMGTNKSNQDLKDILWAPAAEVATAVSSDNEDAAGNGDSVYRTRNNVPTNDDTRSSGNIDRRAAFADSVMGGHAAAFSSVAEAATMTPPAGAVPTLTRPFRKTESGRFNIKDMLDTWEEPESKGDKGSDISIHDILKFRRALSHLDEDHPFGTAFGPAMNRDQCIASSHSVYQRLLKLAPTEDGSTNETVLAFDVLVLLTLEEDGKTENLAKKRILKRILTPDPSGKLPLLAFVQACDQIYKRLRYFRASIRNSSVIDQVLERIANSVFYFVLAMSLSSLMQFNPWTFLVSITSLLVYFYFALGSSISKYVEGVLLIAVRRPYDLGDRIFMSSAETINPMPDVSTNTWFVEDITLTTTTLRYARTNEVCTVNNWSIAGSRIVNCARSVNATVHFEFKAHLSILEGPKLEQFRNAIQKYVDEHPRVWDSIAHLRHDEFDADDERVTFALAIRHRCAWQEAGRIKVDRSGVFRFLYELGKKLDVNFEKPPDQTVIYEGGILRRSDTEDMTKKMLLARSNTVPHVHSKRVPGGDEE